MDSRSSDSVSKKEAPEAWEAGQGEKMIEMVLTGIAAILITPLVLYWIEHH